MATDIFNDATEDDRNRLELARTAGSEIEQIVNALDLVIKQEDSARPCGSLRSADAQ